MASQGREVYSLISTEGVRPLQGLRFRASQPLTGTNLLGISPSHGTIFIKKKGFSFGNQCSFSANFFQKSFKAYFSNIYCKEMSLQNRFIFIKHYSIDNELFCRVTFLLIFGPENPSSGCQC